MSMAEESTSEGNPQDPADTLIDQYIKNLEETKKDPNKKKEFLEEYQKSAAKHKEASEQPENPFSSSSTEESSRGSIGLVDHDESEEEEEPKQKRVIPTGTLEGAAKKGAKSLLDEIGIQIPEDLESSVTDDAQRLLSILSQNKVKGAGYIIQNYIKKTYASPRRAAERLNRLLGDVGCVERTRRIVLNTYFELSERAIDNILHVDEDDEDDEEDRSRKSRSKANSELVRIPVRQNGQIVRDSEGKPIIVEVTKEELYWASQTGSSSSGANEDIAQMLLRTQEKGHTESMKLLEDQKKFWQTAASSDPIKSLLQHKKELVDLGLVSGDLEKPSDYQTKMIKEARASGKELFDEVKPEIKSMVEMLRDDIIKPAINQARSSSKSEDKKPGDELPKDIKMIPEADKEEIFNALEASLEEEKKSEEKKK
jgi:hypothetical protein